MSDANITTLFLDIGGVLLTDGWNHVERRRAVDKFNLEFEEFDDRHGTIFNTFEEGKISLDTYLDRVVFYKDRSFSRDDFRSFMFAQSEPHQEMISLIKKLKKAYNLALIAVSNEGRELNAHRIQTFDLHEYIDAFISSSYVHVRKPDPEIFRLALDISQAKPKHIIFIDDRNFHVQTAAEFGIHGLHHTALDSTRNELASYGLSTD